MIRLRPEWPNSHEMQRCSCSDCCGAEFESTCNILGQNHHVCLFKYLLKFLSSEKVEASVYSNTVKEKRSSLGLMMLTFQ